jgi:hypothetical protein
MRRVGTVRLPCKYLAPLRQAGLFALYIHSGPNDIESLRIQLLRTLSILVLRRKRVPRSRKGSYEVRGDSLCVTPKAWLRYLRIRALHDTTARVPKYEVFDV